MTNLINVKNRSLFLEDFTCWLSQYDDEHVIFVIMSTTIINISSGLIHSSIPVYEVMRMTELSLGQRKLLQAFCLPAIVGKRIIGNLSELPAVLGSRSCHKVWHIMQGSCREHFVAAVLLRCHRADVQVLHPHTTDKHFSGMLIITVTKY